MEAPPKGTGKKILIVVEEAIDGNGFNVYMDGDKERISAGIETALMTPAEFWGSKLFGICVMALRQHGAVQKEIPMGAANAKPL
jgi:hypothetical protein